MDTFQSYGRQPFIRHISVQRHMHNAHINTYQNNITSTLAMHGLLNPTFVAAIATVELCLDLLYTLKCVKLNFHIYFIYLAASLYQAKYFLEIKVQR